MSHKTLGETAKKQAEERAMFAVRAALTHTRSARSCLCTAKAAAGSAEAETNKSGAMSHKRASYGALDEALFAAERAAKEARENQYKYEAQAAPGKPRKVQATLEWAMSHKK